MWEQIKNMVINGNLRGSSGLGPEKTQSDDCTYPTTSVKLTVCAFNGDIQVHTWKHSKIRLKSTKFARGEKAEAALQNMTVRTSFDATQAKIETCFARSETSNAGIHYELWIPKTMTISLQTKNGDITVDNLNGSASMISANGNISVTALIGKLIASSSNGNIVLTHIQGDIDATTSNGDIQVTAPHSQQITLKSANGDITCSAPASFTGGVTLQTVMGDLICRYPVEGTIKSTRIEGTVGTGNGKISITTSLGDIDLVRCKEG